MRILLILNDMFLYVQKKLEKLNILFRLLLKSFYLPLPKEV